MTKHAENKADKLRNVYAFALNDKYSTLFDQLCQDNDLVPSSMARNVLMDKLDENELLRKQEEMKSSETDSDSM